MSDIVCVTNRRLCAEDFLERIARIASCHPAAVLLREKDLPEAEYETLARQVMEACAVYEVPCILHTYAEAALRLGAPAVHFTFPDFCTAYGKKGGICPAHDGELPALGVSVHAPEEAREAERIGCTYLIAGHLFDTDCKEGLPGRGLSFLREVCACVSVPVLAIGGIDAAHAAQVRRAGAAGICVMSGIMQCADVEHYLNSLR